MIACARQSSGSPHGDRSLATVTVSDSSLNDYTVDQSFALRAQMMDELYPTLSRLLIRHYETQGWSFDRMITPEDAAVRMDERFYALCLCFSDVCCAVYAIFPTLTFHDDEYHWVLCNELVQYTVLTTPPSMWDRISIFRTALAIEQQMQVLNDLLP